MYQAYFIKKLQNWSKNVSKTAQTRSKHGSFQELQVPVQVHGAIELCALVLISVQVALKTRWIGWRTFMLHKRTAIKVFTLAIMIIEALVVLVNR